jgi:hypothetical protein
MGISELLALISGIVKFLPEIRKLVAILSNAPAEKAALVSKMICDEEALLKADGRPKW